VEEDTGGEWLSGNDGGDVGHELSLNELAALVGLSVQRQRSEKEDREEESGHQRPSHISPDAHGVI